MRKGHDGSQLITVLSNLGVSGHNYTLKLANTGWKSGQIVYDLLTCASATVGSDSTLLVPMYSGLPKIYYEHGSVSGC